MVKGPWNEMGWELPKWPLLLVTGAPVSQELGEEICVRTSQPSAFDVMIDDEAWREEVLGAFRLGLDLDTETGWNTAESVDRVREELRILDLEYLANDRVSATRTERPTGWCDWDGTIGTEGVFLTAKRPRLADLTRELELIATAFPSLVMTVQLVTDGWETTSSNEVRDPHRPLVTWLVLDGEVKWLTAPGELIRPVRLPSEDEVLQAMGEPHSGRGCTAETLRRATDRVRGTK